MPLVSVVIPTHNRSDRLQAAVASALAQTERDVEILIVDDGSTDDTPAVIERIERADGRARAVRLGGGSGAATARNAGIAASSGEFLAFLDDDDEWQPGKLEEQIRYLRDHPDVGLVSCDFTIVGAGPPMRHRGIERLTPAPLLWANVLMGCSFVMIHRPSYSFEPQFDESVVPAEDWDLWLRCSDERGIAIVPSDLARYTRHGVQLTGTADRLQRGETAFLAKNESRMSSNARGFHRAHLAMQGSSGGGGRMSARLGIVRSAPRPVVGVMVRLAIARRVGRLRKDPGAPVRALIRAVDRIERA